MKSKFVLLIVNGIILELIAIVILIKGTWSISAYVSLHIIACASCMTAIDTYKRSYQHYNYSIKIFLFSLMFVLSLLGMIGSILLSRWLLTAQKKYQKHNIKSVALNENIRPLINRFGIIRLRTHLLSQDVSLYNRVDALKIISKMSSPKKNILIRSVLPDKADELRLLAFNLINHQESEFVPLINQAMSILKQNSTARRKCIVHKWLALQYWELVYRSLAEPALIDYMLRQSVTNLKLASIMFRKDPSLRFLLGKVYLRQHKPDYAIKAFEEAIKCGASALRIFPYIAEAYYLQRDYAAIRSYIRLRIDVNIAIIYTRLINFWLPTHD